MAFPLEHGDHLAASLTLLQTLWAVVVLMLLQAKALHLIVAQLALHKNFSTHGTMSIHVAAPERLTARVTRRWAVRANHHVVGHISALE